ncbi:MAG: MerR family transcriptional regulator [Lachnospiraceae bacterium]|nr:MerR family transcriptional regulator [Lachnospiraceae bacterium]
MTYDEYCISAGEFAKLCKTTRDTLRYYDKMGILTPKKNEENGYRYYSHNQITTFYFINAYRTLDCPVKYLKHFMENAHSEEFYELVNTQYASLLKMKNELDQKLNLISSVVDLINHVKNTPNGEVILEKRSRPIRVFCTDIKSSPAYSSNDIIKDITNHINICNESKTINAFPLGCAIMADNFFNGDYAYYKMFSLADNAPVSENIYVFPTKNVVSCICDDSKETIYNVYEKIQQYISDNSLAAKSDIYSLSLMNLVDSSETKRYLKYIFVSVD